MMPSKRKEQFDGPHEMKRADRRKSINVLTMGDDSVGKSCLISSFVSRVYTPEVPGIMTRVQLPADPGTSCTTTIIDSQHADAALVQALELRGDVIIESATQPPTTEMESSSPSSQPYYTGVDTVDSIVLVYDLDRPETFHRLEKHWLPLIQQYYQGKIPVIIAENKVDLFDADQVSQKRQQIVSLMQQFPFVRQCIKCSARTMTRVDDVWFKAQQAVLYPLTLYDLEKGELTGDCQRAFGRMFRMYDRDADGLLSNLELERFERDTFPKPIFPEFSELRKAVSRHASNSVHEEKLTEAGFVAVFDIFISQNRLDVVWQALRCFGYDDDLQLYIPPDLPISKKLSSNAKKFLTGLFYQFDSNQDGTLSSDDLWHVFSVLPSQGLPPWHPHRDLFHECFSNPITSELSPASSLVDSSHESKEAQQLIVPGSPMAQSLSNSGLSVLSASDSLPSLALVQQSLTYWEWMGCWHVINAISPEITATELFRLGFSERKRPIKFKSKAMKSREIRILVLGATETRNRLLQRLCRISNLSSDHPETCTTHQGFTKSNGDQVMVHYIFTNVPSQVEVVTSGLVDFDLALLAFDQDPASWTSLKTLSCVTDSTPRVYVSDKSSLPAVEDYCRMVDIEKPLLTDLMATEDILNHLARCVRETPLVERLRSVPYEEQNRKDAARRRTMIWLGGIVGVVVVVGVGFFIKQPDRSFWLWLRPRAAPRRSA